MKVLHLNNEYPPIGGGTATVTAELLPRLAKLSGVPQVVVTSGGTGSYSRECLPGGAGIVHRLGLRQRCIHHSTVLDLVKFGFAATAFVIKGGHHKETSYVVSWCTLPAGFVAVILKFLFGLPFVVRVSGPDIPGFERRYRRLYPVLTPFLRYIWRRAELVICKCEEERNAIRQLEPKARFAIVPNGVDTERYVPTAAPKGKLLRIVCVARLIERKRQDLLIDAVAVLRQRGVPAVLSLVGDGDMQQAFEARARELGLIDAVTFWGPVPRSEIPAILSSHDVFALPSEAEAMSVAALEALAAGLPLVVSRQGGSELLVEDGVNGYIISHVSASALAESLAALAESNELRERFSAASRARAAKFSWDAAADLFIAAVRERQLSKGHQAFESLSHDSSNIDRTMPPN